MAPSHSASWGFAVASIGVLLAFAIAQLDPFLIGGTALAVGFLLLFLARPFWGLLLVLLVRSSTDLTFRFLAVDGAGGRIGAIPNIVLILTLTLAGGVYILSRSAAMISLPGGRLLALLLVVGLVGVIRSDSSILAMNEWMPVLASFVTYSLAAHLVRGPADAQRVSYVITASFILPASLGLHQLISKSGVVRPDFPIPAVVGSFLHPNTFGFYLVILVAVFLSRAVYDNGRRRATVLFLLGLTLALLLFTYARVAWAGALVVFLVVAILRARLVLVLLPLGVLLAFVLAPGIDVRIGDALARGGSLGDRLYNLWPRTVSAWLSATGTEGGGFLLVLNRLTGLGPGAGTAALGRFGLSAIPHNDYLRVLIEYGILGLVLYFALTIGLAAMAYRTWRDFGHTNPEASAATLSFFALTLAFPIMSTTDNIFAHTVNQVYFWTLAGLTAAVKDWRSGT
jgi:hypothetical protein